MEGEEKGRGANGAGGTGAEGAKSTAWLALIVSALTDIGVDDSHVPSQ